MLREVADALDDDGGSARLVGPLSEAGDQIGIDGIVTGAEFFLDRRSLRSERR